MTQDEIDRAEWRNPANWGGPRSLGGFFEVYFSQRDSRIWVPRRKRWMGWTVNLARPGGVWWLVSVCVGSVLLVFASAVYTIGYR